MIRTPCSPVFLKLLCSLTLLTGGESKAAALPVALVGSDANCYGSIEDAAVAGILAAAEISRRVEYGGAVFRRDAGCFVHSNPVTNHLPSQLNYRVRSAQGHMVLVGVFHTHTPGGHADVFSEVDVDTQRRLGVPSFIGTLDARGRKITIRLLDGVDADIRPAKAACNPVDPVSP